MNNQNNNQYQRYSGNSLQGYQGGVPPVTGNQQPQQQGQNIEQGQHGEWIYTNAGNASNIGNNPAVVPFLDLSSNQQQQQQQQQQQRYSFSQDGNAILMNPFGRGYSIVNSNATLPVSTTTSSGVSAGNVPPQQPVLRQPSYGKRNSSMSTFFIPNDPNTTDMDIFRKDSMKPPILIPQQHGQPQQQQQQSNPNNRFSNSSNEFESFIQQPQMLHSTQIPMGSAAPGTIQQGSIFNVRNPRFNDDFNFQFRSRKSSLRDSLDSGNSARLSQIGNQFPNNANMIQIEPIKHRQGDNGLLIHEGDIQEVPSGTNENDDDDDDDMTPIDPLQKRKRIKTEPFLRKHEDHPSDHEDENEDKLKLVGTTKVDQLMLMIQARQKGITEKIKTKPNGELILDENSGIMPPKDELVGGIEKPKIDSHDIKPSNFSSSQGNSISSGDNLETVNVPTTTILPTNSNIHDTMLDPSSDNVANTLAISSIPNSMTLKDKKYQCQYCHKFFSQPTHLEVHIRSHVGHKPFKCKFCGRHFTQGGNLRTHQKLHTGEKPYSCDVCFKKFSRKGNLAAHLLTHQNIKPFICKLDNCNKGFTQLGNMKAHQNRFHLDTLLHLTSRLATMETDINSVSEDERELLNYFASIYKNSNKGIKGRGKGSTKIIPNNDFQTSPMSITSDSMNSRNSGSQNHSEQMSASNNTTNKNYTTAPHINQQMNPNQLSSDKNGLMTNNNLKNMSGTTTVQQHNSNTTPKPQQTQSFAPNDPLVGNILQLTGNNNNANNNINSSNNNPVTSSNPNLINNYQMNYQPKQSTGTTSNNIPNSINTATFVSDQDKYQLGDGSN